MADKSEQLNVAALVFAESHQTVTARGLVDFCAMAGVTLEEEDANELLLALVAAGRVREIGPGVYAHIPGSAPMEHPIFSEEETKH